MYKLFNIIFIFILIGIIIISLFSFNNVKGIIIAIIYIIIIILTLIISYFSIKNKMYISIILISSLLFLISIIYSLSLYKTYSIPNNFF